MERATDGSNFPLSYSQLAMLVASRVLSHRHKLVALRPSPIQRALRDLVGASYGPLARLKLRNAVKLAVPTQLIAYKRKSSASGN